VGLGDIFRVIYSPIETFSRIEKSRSSFFDGFLFFVFVQTFILGFYYVFLSMMGDNYWMGGIISMVISVSPIPFLSSPGIMSYLVSMILAFVEIIILAAVFHGVSKFVHKSTGSFSTTFTLLSISQIVTIFPVLILPFASFSYGIVEMMIVPLFGYIIMTVFWKYLLYGFTIGTSYKTGDANIVVTMILAFLIFFLVYPWILRVVLWTVARPEILNIGTFGLKSVSVPTGGLETVGTLTK